MGRKKRVENADTKWMRWLLVREWEARCSRNLSYSQRAFARDIGVTHTTLSLVFLGKRLVSKGLAGRMLAHFQLTKKEEKRLVTLIAGSAPPKRQVVSSRDDLESICPLLSPKIFALMSLLETEGATLDAKWISKHLDISESRAAMLIERLASQGIVFGNDDPAFRFQPPSIRFDRNPSSKETQQFHRELLTEAANSLYKHPPQLRNHSSITIAIDPSLVPLAQKQIREFRLKLAEKLESKGNRTQVFHLSVQLFPTSRTRKEEKK